ncbi:membrane protein [Kitasatospora paracochleata]|uniref:Transmembrane protein n=1 Tax=Kitasatospora paracochleata TaxID=58354 RepID=A0ABT1J3L5_9ACTN|nr:hypothetical protein [Kitasatospora paracochleata]MCP2312017.1 hypothetical protein [Kitasatospora paracochleata]
MDVPPRLSQQDRADFERALNRALTREPVRDALRAAGAAGADGAESERLRALARRSVPEILAGAAPEYAAYARLRTAAEAAPPPDRPSTTENSSGWLGVLALIVPILTGSAGAIFFLLGAMLGLVPSQRTLGLALWHAGAAAAVVAATSALAGVIGLLTAAARRPPGGAAESLADDALWRAREAWRSALLERGMLPFLVDQLPPGPSA